MAVRIRTDGRILCAAMFPAREGDFYIDDGVHYMLSVEKRLLVTEPMNLPGGGGHGTHGEWWWKGEEPEWAQIDSFYFGAGDRRDDSRDAVTPSGVPAPNASAEAVSASASTSSAAPGGETD